VKPISFHPDAEAEVIDAARYYERSEPGLGSDFLGEVERALGQIAANPNASQRIGKRVRRKPLWRFPYNLIYAAYSDQIRIAAVAHQKRRPFYWRSRLKEIGVEKGPARP
jgi:plasmid stabilization system protein ParE